MSKSISELKEKLIEEFNSLGIDDMKTVTELYLLKGSFINLEYTLPSGQVAKLWDDNRTYLGAEICKNNGDRCYGLVADDGHLLVCEYGDNGSNPEIIVYKKRKG